MPCTLQGSTTDPPPVPADAPWSAVVHVGAVTFDRGESPGLAAGLVLGSAIREVLRLAYLAPPGAPLITEAAYNTLPAPPSARPWPPAARLLGLPARALVEGAA